MDRKVGSSGLGLTWVLLLVPCLVLLTFTPLNVEFCVAFLPINQLRSDVEIEMGTMKVSSRYEARGSRWQWQVAGGSRSIFEAIHRAAN